MLDLHGCPRCNGAVVEYPWSDDGTYCINCGWRRPDISPEIQAQVEAHLGKSYMETHYAHNRIATGKPPLSGWERIKRARERARRLKDDAAEVARSGGQPNGGARRVGDAPAVAM